MSTGVKPITAATSASSTSTQIATAVCSLVMRSVNQPLGDVDAAGTD